MSASLSLLVLSLLVGGLALRFLRPRRWARPEVRRGYYLLLALLVPAWLLWMTGVFLGLRTLALAGVVIVGTSVVTLLPLALSLSISDLAGRMFRSLRRRRTASREVSGVTQSAAERGGAPAVASGPVSRIETPVSATEAEMIHAAAVSPELDAPRILPWPSMSSLPPIDAGPGLSRRAVLALGANIVPLASLSMSGSGLAAAARGASIPVIRMGYPDLPAELAGLKILHISDLHLGWFVDLKDFEAMLERAAALKPDLILMTGDITDDLKQLADALAITSGLRPRLGVFASLGNHEYYRGARQVRRIYDSSPVPLLVESSATVAVGNARLQVLGADDPVHRRDPTFLARTIDRCLESAPSDAFHLLMSHRPRGFVPAAERGIQLTLSGHTHGGQVGVGGRSVFEKLAPEQFLWGSYSRGNSRLYTSSGAGHWFPFRLGCPAEMPLIVLEPSVRTDV